MRTGSMPIALTAFSSAVLATALLASQSPKSPPSVARSARSNVAETRGFQVGVTHTQHSADAWGNQTAVRRAEDILRSVGPMQNQHLMGWGTLNPEPKPGVYDWASLDARVALMRRTGATIVITLCGAPDWAKGGQPGETDWSKLEAAPTSAYYGDFAALAVQVAKRYPDAKYFQVWNEFKGFYLAAKNRWDYEAYTKMYNAVYDALKAHNPRLCIGGPYVPMDSWHEVPGEAASDLRGSWGVVDQRALNAVNYWLKNKHGADFLTVDGGMQTKDHFVPPVQEGAQKFAAITRWLRQRTNLPIWWAEFYVGLKAGSDVSTPEAIHAALEAMRDAGASVALLWGGEDNGQFPGLWTPTSNADGGQPTAYLPILREYSGHPGLKRSLNVGQPRP